MHPAAAAELLERNREVYDKIAPHFAATRKDLWEDLKPLRRFAKNGDVVLDLGCGGGRLTRLFDGLQVQYLGVDYSAAQLELARRSYPTAEFVLADIREVPRPSQTFDVIFAVAVLHHLPSREFRLAALCEMKRLAKPGANIILTNWNLFSRAAREKARAGKWREFAPGELDIPWNGSQDVAPSERYYHAFTPDELFDLIKECGGKAREQYFSRQGVRAEQPEGDNIITIFSFTS